jgi:hypothetical protein
VVVPGTADSLQRLVVQFASENLGLHADPRALRNLGHELGRNTIKRVLAAHGLEPADPAAPIVRRERLGGILDRFGDHAARASAITIDECRTKAQ